MALLIESAGSLVGSSYPVHLTKYSVPNGAPGGAEISRALRKIPAPDLAAGQGGAPKQPSGAGRGLFSCPLSNSPFRGPAFSGDPPGLPSLVLTISLIFCQLFREKAVTWHSIRAYRRLFSPIEHPGTTFSRKN